MAERHRRIAEIRAWLANNPAPPDDLLAPILDELGKLLYSVGDYDAALAHWRDQGLPLYVRLRDERARVITLGNIADILQERGELDEALRIYREEQLPVLERLGDVRSLLVTRANLASTLLARAAVGDREEADQLLRLALTEAERLHLPEAEWIRAVRKRAGLLDE
jgi:tetratricopeptide (TPR) repeat protein